MKVLNKIASFATVVAMCATFATTAFAANGTLSLTTEKTTLEPGSTFTVSVNVTSNPGIIVGQLCASVPNGLELVGAASTGLFGDGDFSTNYIDGYMFMLGDEGASENFTTTGAVATLTYKVSDSASGDYTIEVYQNPEDTFYNVDFDEINFDSATLKITVKAAAPTVEATKNAETGVITFTTPEANSKIADKYIVVNTAKIVDGSKVTADTRVKVTCNGKTKTFGNEMWEEAGFDGEGGIKTKKIAFGIVFTDSNLKASDFTFEIINLAE